MSAEIFKLETRYSPRTSPKRHGACYGRDREAFSLNEERDDGTDNAETFAAEQPDTDLAVDIRAALSGLGDKARQIAELMLVGYRGRDLCKAAGVSKQLLSYYCRQIKQVWFTPNDNTLTISSL